jgi:hypothetical protein
VDAAAFVINFTETVTVPLTLTLSFALPANANDPGVIAALQREAVSAAYEAIQAATGGVVPYNLTVVPSTSTNTDGTVTVTMRVRAGFSASVNSTTTASASSYAADPAGVTATAVKAASNGAAVASTTAGLNLAAKRAAAIADAFANGTIVTGTPPSTLASRFAAVTSAVLIAAGRSSAAALVNASIVAPKVTAIDVGSPTVDTSNEKISGIASTYGIAASDSFIAPSELVSNGLISGAAFAASSLLALYLYVRRPAPPAKMTKLAIARATAEMINPLYTKRPRRPSTAGGKQG